MPSRRTSEAHAGRVALVTGAAHGIGQAIAVGLAECGARIVLGDLGDMSETSSLVAGIGQPALPVRLDVSDPASIEAARSRVADELGRVDILVNNAGIFEAAARDDLDFDLWSAVMAVDLNGPMLMCKAFLPLMRGRGRGQLDHRSDDHGQRRERVRALRLLDLLTECRCRRFLKVTPEPPNCTASPISSGPAQVA